jgi:alkylation response protein AidB-like acyl-CoA dehydrogenase
MKLEFTPQQLSERAAFRRFAAEEIAPLAAGFDRDEFVSPEVIRKVAERGYLASMLPVEWGGRGFDMVTTACSTRPSGRRARPCAAC